MIRDSNQERRHEALGDLQSLGNNSDESLFSDDEINDDEEGSFNNLEDVVDVMTRQEIEKKRINEEHALENLRSHIKRRNQLLLSIRKCYLNDVVVMKEVINSVLKKHEREEAMAEYNSRLPSLSLKAYLDLYSPPECVLDVIPCETCGGHVEIIHRESNEMARLSKSLALTMKRDEELRVTNAEQSARLQKVGSQIEDIERKNREEKAYLMREIKTLKTDVEEAKQENANLQSLNKAMKSENGALRRQSAECQRLQVALASSTEECQRLQQNIATLEDDVRKRSEEQASLKVELGKRNAEISALNTLKDELTSELGAVKAEFKETNKMLHLTQKKATGLQSQLDTSKKETATLASAKEALTTEMAEMKRHFAEEQEAFELLTEKLRQDAALLTDALQEGKMGLYEAQLHAEEEARKMENLIFRLNEADVAEKALQVKLADETSKLAAVTSAAEFASQAAAKQLQRQRELTAKAEALAKETAEAAAMAMDGVPVGGADGEGGEMGSPVGKAEGRHYAINKPRKRPLLPRSRPEAGQVAEPAGDDAEDETASVAATENAMLEEVFMSLACVVGEGVATMAKKTLAPLLRQYGSSIAVASKGFWEALLICKRSLDFDSRLAVGYQGVMACGGLQYTMKQIDDVTREFMTSEKQNERDWVADNDVDENVAKMLCGNVADANTGRIRYKNSAEFFGYDSEKRLEKLKLAFETVKKMREAADHSLEYLDLGLRQTMDDWYVVKSAYVAECEANKADKRRMRDDHELEVLHLNKELAAANQNIIKLKKEIGELEVQVMQQNGQILEMRAVKSVLMETRESLSKTSMERNALTIELSVLKSEYGRSQSDWAEKDFQMTEEISSKADRIQELEVSLMASLQRERDGQERLLTEIDKRKAVTNLYEDFKERDRHRLEELQTVSVQTCPDYATVAVQTEFICPPLSLRYSTSVPGTASRKAFPIVRISSYSKDGQTGQTSAEADKRDDESELMSLVSDFRGGGRSVGSGMTDSEVTESVARLQRTSPFAPRTANTSIFFSGDSNGLPGVPASRQGGRLPTVASRTQTRGGDGRSRAGGTQASGRDRNREMDNWDIESRISGSMHSYTR